MNEYDITIENANHQSNKDWKAVHRQLSLAILMTQDAIQAEKAKRRFLLEEILNNISPDGTLVHDSNWGQRQRVHDTAKQDENDDGITKHVKVTEQNDDSGQVRPERSPEQGVPREAQHQSLYSSSNQKDTIPQSSPFEACKDLSKDTIVDSPVKEDDQGPVALEDLYTNITSPTTPVSSSYWARSSEEIFRTLLQEQGSSTKDIGVDSFCNDQDDSDGF